jgi:hypothetical protein
MWDETFVRHLEKLHPLEMGIAWGAPGLLKRLGGQLMEGKLILADELLLDL